MRSKRPIPRLIFHPFSAGVDRLARRLRLPPATLEANRWRWPDGTISYHPRFRWSLLTKAIVEHFIPIFTPSGTVIYVADTDPKFAHSDTASFAKLGVTLDAAAKMPDVVIHDTRRNWLLLIEAVTSAGWVDGKRRMELKQLFRDSTAGLVFVTAFETRRTMQAHISLLSWETEVWIAESPEHMIHLNGSRFLGPYPDVLPPP